MARVLVTGATGFIGRNLVERLVQRDDQVLCLIRRPGQEGTFAPWPVAYRRGDLLQPDTLDQALGDVEVVYHLAGATRVLTAKMFDLVNARGTHNLALACARQSRPPRLVFVSSLAAAGPAPCNCQPLTEETNPLPVSEYGWSKLRAERFLRRVAERVPISVLRPPAVFGPHDPNMLSLFQVAGLGINLAPGGKNLRLSWLYVTDLVEALLLASERGRRLTPALSGPEQGQGVYFLAMDERPTVAEISRLAAQSRGKRFFGLLMMPAYLCRFLAQANDLRMKLTGKPLFFTPDKISEVLAGPWICSAEKAKRELGFSCRVGLAEGMRRTAQWYQEQGWL